jgi:hypothetical protein
VEKNDTTHGIRYPRKGPDDRCHRAGGIRICKYQRRRTVYEIRTQSKKAIPFARQWVWQSKTEYFTDLAFASGKKDTNLGRALLMVAAERFSQCSIKAWYALRC